jgi:hypothetical protein
MTVLSGYYQLPEGISTAGLTATEVELLDFSTGQLLVESGTSTVLTATEDIVVASGALSVPVVINNTSESVISVNAPNYGQPSAVSTSLLGIPKEETKLAIFESVNTYGANSQYWGSYASYTYFQDPSAWTFRDTYGYFAQSLTTEAALQAYVYPVPVSFTYTYDDNTGRYPGGYTNGVQTAIWRTKKNFRYQPGRITGVTLGVRMSTNSQLPGEVIQWGVKNDVGDGYYFQLERGTDLYIVRTSPDLGTLKVARDDWNGDPITATSPAAWNLDLSKTTMFAIEFGWYGAIGARFLAYVPSAYRDSRWVVLHEITACNEYAYPSLRSPFMYVFGQVQSVAGATQPTFINLYGSSVYIDGGDKGTINVNSAATPTPLLVDSKERTLLGLQIRPTVNNVTNVQTAYPISATATADVDAKLSFVFAPNRTTDINYSPGYGTILSRGASAPITVTCPTPTTLSGSFPNISGELSGTLTYTTGRRVKVVGAGIYATHVQSVSADGRVVTVTSPQDLPSGTTSVTLSRFNAWALSSGTISSGVTQGSIYYTDGGGYWRIGLVPNASGTTYNTNTNVVWAATSYPGVNYNLAGQIVGESAFPQDDYSTSFTITSGTSSTITAGGQTLTLSGVTNPYPVKIVVEMQDNSQLSDLVYTTVSSSAITSAPANSTVALTEWTTSGVAITSTDAGGPTYRSNQFSVPSSNRLSACLVDTQGYRILETPERVATYFVASGQVVTLDLSNIFGPDKRYLAGPLTSVFSTGSLYLTGQARTGSGFAQATLNWEEQQ